MKAWQFTDTHQPLVLNEVPEPKAAPGEVVLEVRAAGLCHSDVGLLEDEGWLDMLAKRPITPGHEVAGVITEVGEGVEGWKAGDRVGVCPTVEGHGAVGYAFDGGYAPRCAVPAATLVALPDSVSFAQGAAGTDSGMTAYHAIVAKGGIKKGDRVGVIGLGGLGQIGARVAVLTGCEVYAAEPNEKVWELGREIGVKEIVKDVTELADKQLDVIVDYAGFGTTTAGAVEAIRPGGTVVQVGMGRLESTISTKSLILKSVILRGSCGGDIDAVKGVYDLMAAGELSPQLTPITFAEISDGLRRLAEGGVVGRLVAVAGE
ncbi:zinc-binding dehydrogenase [Streptomyces sp. UH6]|uniref:zinc-binding dehydrogenase n=1 Tax=Streptomyces sp. UH6 TaxID=2748379 RepID=UPI0015D4E99A|nr:zinc-binding dehydrogenase [Streptomyces sp. UH6]NYV76576.1 alcohol dehydrogenase catalytic domain-containing protein [Streptomyces sp. UH6]